MINRAALLLRYKTAALKWIIESDPQDATLRQLSLEDINKDRQLYLIHEIDAQTVADWREWIERNFEAIFENELASWHIDDELWPEKLSLALFDEWFDVECHTMVTDTVASPIEDDDDSELEDWTPPSLLN